MAFAQAPVSYTHLDVYKRQEECIAAAKLSNADAFIRNLPDGYQTVLTQKDVYKRQARRRSFAAYAPFHLQSPRGDLREYNQMCIRDSLSVQILPISFS